jgi:hypothetical protein
MPAAGGSTLVAVTVGLFGLKQPPHNRCPGALAAQAFVVEA